MVQRKCAFVPCVFYSMIHRFNFHCELFFFAFLYSDCYCCCCCCCFRLNIVLYSNTLFHLYIPLSFTLCRSWFDYLISTECICKFIYLFCFVFSFYVYSRLDCQLESNAFKWLSQKNKMITSIVDFWFGFHSKLKNHFLFQFILFLGSLCQLICALSESKMFCFVLVENNENEQNPKFNTH